MRSRYISPADSAMRASDEERNAVADTLSRHFAEGRLDQTEFKERLDRAMGAKTRGDLDGLSDDLPRLPSPAPATPSRRHRLLPFLMLLALLVVATSWTFPYLGGFHISWVLVVIVGYFWVRSGRHFHHRHHHDHAAVER